MYIHRNLENLAEKLLNYYPVLAVIGPRQAGKTEFVKNIRKNWKYYDIERDIDYKLISNNISLFFEENNEHIIIDEAQEYPKLFKELRGVIDEKRNQKNRFILTGSSSPKLISELSESLAGRVGIIELNTLKANEYYKLPLSDFYNIFKEKLSKNVKVSEPQITNKEMRHCWFYGGYPEPLFSEDKDFHYRWMQDYQKTYIDRDIAKLFPRLNHRAYQIFLSTLSHLSGTILNKSEIARSIEVSEGALREYLQIAEGTFMWRTINYYANNTLKSMVKRPKGNLRDSGLLHYLMNIKDMNTLLVHPNAGNSFEGFIIEEIIQGLEATNIGNVDVSFYRTHNGAEIDLILEGSFGTLPIEIKMASSITPKHLKNLHKMIDDKNLPLGIIINQGKEVCWVSNTVLQVPIGCL